MDTAVTNIRQVLEAAARKVDEQITVDPEIMHGMPVITGTRIPVALVLGMLEDGYSLADIQKEYPKLTLQQIKATIRYAAEIAGGKA